MNLTATGVTRHVSVSGKASLTVCTGLQAQCNATGVTQIRRPPGVGLELSVSGIFNYFFLAFLVKKI